MHLVALTRFKRTLPLARYEVRQLTHTLHLPPAQSELYDGPRSTWLRDMLERLPSLQSLVVSQLPFFDHGSLLALRQPSLARQQRYRAQGFHDACMPEYPLRLLIATDCDNTTSAGLATALPLWPSLVFLDLSGTLAARDAAVLLSLRAMPALQVLKLRHVQLRDADIEVLAPAIGIRVRSLDVRNNKLTDESVRTLLAHCFHSTRDVHAAQSRSVGPYNGVDGEEWPDGCPRPDAHVLSQFKGDDMDARFVRRLTRAVVGRIPTEDLPPTGLTHLYVSDNFITVEALASVLRTENLHVLDAGSADTARALGRKRSSTVSSISHLEGVSLPRAEKLAPVLEQAAARNLTYLRLHHSVVTEPAPLKDDTGLSVPELDGGDIRPELDFSEPARHEAPGDSTMRFELDDSGPIFELSADPASPREELPSDPLHIVVSPAVDSAPPSAWDDPTSPEASHRSVVASENTAAGSHAGDSMVLTTTGLGNIAQAINGVPFDDEYSPSPITVTPTGSRGSPLAALAPKDAAVARAEEARDALAKIESQRYELRHGVRDASRALLPGLVPDLRTLVLTDVPTYTSKPSVVANLRAFMSDCAREQHLAARQASLETQPPDHSPKSMDPHHSRSTLQADRARSLFALRRIVLEMAPVSSATASVVDGPTSPRPTTANSLRSPQSPLRSGFSDPPLRGGPPLRAWRSRVRQQQENYSSTEDVDTEAFWQAQQHDFSFFGDEECGLPASDTRIPLSAFAEKVALTDDDEDDEGEHGGTLAPGSGSGGGTWSTQRGSPPASLRRGSTAGSLHPDTAAEGREEPRVLDVVAELARWRTERKAVWESVGKEVGFVEGYWPGEVNVIRLPPPGLRHLDKGASWSKLRQ